MRGASFIRPFLVALLFASSAYADTGRSAWAEEAIVAAYEDRIGKSTHVSRTIVRMASKEAGKYALDLWLVLGVIQVESMGDAQAISNKGAMGLMQIMPTTGEWLAAQMGEEWMGEESLLNGEVNIRYGVYYLYALIKDFDGSITLALASYYNGPTRIRNKLEKGQRIPLGYVHKVFVAAYGP